jgi:hypothetical protein
MGGPPVEGLKRLRSDDLSEYGYSPLLVYRLMKKAYGRCDILAMEIQQVDASAKRVTLKSLAFDWGYCLRLRDAVAELRTRFGGARIVIEWWDASHVDESAAQEFLRDLRHVMEQNRSLVRSDELTPERLVGSVNLFALNYASAQRLLKDAIALLHANREAVFEDDPAKVDFFDLAAIGYGFVASGLMYVVALEAFVHSLYAILRDNSAEIPRGETSLDIKIKGLPWLCQVTCSPKKPPVRG